MKYLLLLLTVFYFNVTLAQDDQAVLEKALWNMPDVQFEKISKPQDKHLKYLLSIKQPLDHLDPQAGFFYQYAVLTHKGFSKPMVMETEGYEVVYEGNEIEKILDANNINIEHRYFGKSKPDSLQWEYLTFEQVTADLHYINRLFRTIYKNRWISTGISRGGQTAIYYKCFYPDDVDLTVPYVAPLPNDLEDKRIYHFLDTIASADCRNKIFNVQRFLLQHESEAVDKFMWYAKGKRLTFNYFGSMEKAFEYWVLEYPFSFWQIGSVPCENIPANKSIDDYLEHLIKVGGIEFLSDKSINEWIPNGYMARTQMGFYGYDLTRFKNYLQHVKGNNPTAAFVPHSIAVKPFDKTFINTISSLLEQRGNNILYVYGSRDTWSACRVRISEHVNSKIFMIPNANHYEARIKNMSIRMQEDFAQSIRTMLGLTPELGALNK